MAIDLAFGHCLVFFGDSEFHWYHRLILLKGKDQAVNWFTPDLEVQFADLSQVRLVPLRQRRAPSATGARST
eukprot:2903074-Lingulodinium_polyedra.AAC.1